MKPIHAILLAALAAGGAAAAPLKTDAAHSSISAVFRQMNVPVEAKFTKFAAALDYDAAHPDASKARIDVDTASLDIGEADMNKEVAKKDWFDSARYPQASFVSSAIRAAGPGRLAVTGKLTIKGRSADVSFPLAVRQEGANQVFEGQLPIRRLAFNVGEGEWKDTSMVADEVVIRFRVAAAKQASK